MNVQEYRNLSEAYLNVYEPQELTEEQVWEEVETWVNSLLEEGYDLSEYTWEEMYESYIEEEQLMERGAPTDPKARAAYDARVAQNRAALGNTILYGNSAGKKPEAPVTRNRNVRGGGTIKPPAGTPSSSPAPAAKPAAPAPAARPAAPAPVAKPATPTTPVKSATPTPAASRPAAGAPAGPTATATPTPTAPKPTASTAPKPAIGTTPGGTKFERRTPTSAELSAARDARAAGKGEEGAIKAGVGASKPATPAPNPVKANVPGFALGGKLPEPKKTPITSSFDYFDVVKGYLIDEGYADTEEAAIAIMGNMSDAWVRSIIG